MGVLVTTSANGESNPDIVGRSDSISISGLSLKVDRALKSKATPEVERVVSKLSRQGIEQVLNLGDSTSWGPNSIEQAKFATQELRSLGVIVEVPQAELDASNKSAGKDYSYSVKTTTVGKQAQAFLKAVMAEFVQQLASQSNAVSLSGEV